MLRFFLSALLAFLALPADATQYAPREWGANKSVSAPYPLAIFDNGTWYPLAALDSRGNLVFPGGTTAMPAFAMVSGVAPTSPNNGDVWWTGSNVFVRQGGATNYFLTCPSLNGACLDSITGFSSTGLLNRTGTGTYAFVSLNSSAATALNYAPCATNGMITQPTPWVSGHVPLIGASGCLTDSGSAAGSGTITGVTAGSGLTGGGSSGTVTIGSDWTQSNGGVQQTVQTGPDDTSGLPTFLPATSGSLSLTSQNVSGSTPLVLDAWGANSSTGAPHLTCGVTSNLTWSSLTASSTVFLYATLSTSGGACTVTPASTTQVPVYQLGGTPSTTSGQITCNIAEHQCYLGNGSTAPQTTLVVLGEITTNGSGVTATIPYSYSGIYDSGWISTLPSTGALTSKNHNLGVVPSFMSPPIEFIMKNLTAENNYSVGDITTLFAATQVFTRNTVGIIVGSGGYSNTMYNKTTGAAATPTAANWAYRIYLTRGW